MYYNFPTGYFNVYLITDLYTAIRVEELQKEKEASVKEASVERNF